MSLERECVNDTDLQIRKAAGQGIAGNVGGTPVLTDSCSSDISACEEAGWGSRRPVEDRARPGPCVAEVQMSEKLQFVIGAHFHYRKSAGQSGFEFRWFGDNFPFCNFSDI